VGAAVAAKVNNVPFCLLSVPIMAALSIVIPNFNHAVFLPGAVESSLRTVTGPAEVLVVDDASTDSSGEVLNSLISRHPLLRVIRHERNLGVEATLNHGFAATSGEYVLFRAADDLSLPDYAELAVRALEAHPRAAFCLGDTRFFGEDENRGRTQRAGFAETATFVAPDRWNEEFGGNELSACSVIFRRSSFAEAGGFDPTLHWTADWVLLVELALQHGFVYLPVPACGMRLSASSYNSAGTLNAAKQAAAFARMLQRLARVADPAYTALRAAGVLDFFATALRRFAPELHPMLSPRERTLLEAVDAPSPGCRRRCGMPAALREFLQDARERLAAAGRIAVLGAGGHTALLLAEWRDTPLPPPVLILESKEPTSSVFAGLPVKSLAQARASEFDSIVISSKSYEPELARLAAHTFPAVPVIRIWT
jgi:hypothetical protein